MSMSDVKVSLCNCCLTETAKAKATAGGATARVATGENSSVGCINRDINVCESRSVRVVTWFNNDPSSIAGLSYIFNSIMALYNICKRNHFSRIVIYISCSDYATTIHFRFKVVNYIEFLLFLNFDYISLTRKGFEALNCHDVGFVSVLVADGTV